MVQSLRSDKRLHRSVRALRSLLLVFACSLALPLASSIAEQGNLQGSSLPKLSSLSLSDLSPRSGMTIGIFSPSVALFHSVSTPSLSILKSSKDGSPAFSTDSTYKIGVMLHLSGEFAPYGKAFLEGAQLACSEVNSAALANSPKLSLVVEDTQYRSNSTHSAAKKLIESDNVVAGIISTAHEARTAGPLFERAHRPLITLWDSSPELDAMGRFVFGIGTWSPASGGKASAEAYSRFHARSAAVFYTNTEWSQQLANSFEQNFKELGGAIVATQGFDPGTVDFRTAILKAMRGKPDVIFAPIDDNIPGFFRQLRVSGSKGPLIITSDIITEDMLTSDPGLYEGVYQTQSLDPSGPSAKIFADKFKQHYGRAPAFLLFSAWGYDSIKLVASAITSHGPLPEQITAGLYKTLNFPGASGPISITPEGSSRSQVGLFVVRDNSISPAY